MAPAIVGFPTISPHLGRRNNNTFGDWRKDNTVEAYIVEAWGQGFMLGALLIMSSITIVNMRRKVLLHKLILLEVFPLLFPHRRLPTNHQ
jgi:F420-0:gamma-glutamyl ligase-like protein